jgi:hypothetical protein
MIDLFVRKIFERHILIELAAVEIGQNTSKITQNAAHFKTCRCLWLTIEQLLVEHKMNHAFENSSLVRKDSSRDRCSFVGIAMLLGCKLSKYHPTAFFVAQLPHRAIISTTGILLRKGVNGGTWIARYRDTIGRQHYESLGPSDDMVMPTIEPFSPSHTRSNELRFSFKGSNRQPLRDILSPMYRSP